MKSTKLYVSVVTVFVALALAITMLLPKHHGRVGGRYPDAPTRTELSEVSHRAGERYHSRDVTQQTSLTK